MYNNKPHFKIIAEIKSGKHSVVTRQHAKNKRSKAVLTMSSLFSRNGEHTLNVHQNGRVVLFGEVLADIFPDRSVLGGAPFNVARHLKAFTRNPVLVSRVGNDDLGKSVLGKMKQYGMTTVGIQLDRAYPTGQVKVHLEGASHKFEILPLQAYDFIHYGIARMIMLPLSPAIVYFGTLAQRHAVSRRALTTLLHSTDAAKLLDINLRTPWYDENVLRLSLQYADILKLNIAELGELAEIFALSSKTPQARAGELLRQFNLDRVLVTCGAEGAWQLNRAGEIIEVMTDDQNTKMIDTVGAGDAFAAVYILGILRDWPVRSTLERAAGFAAAICGIRGAIPEHTDFYDRFIREWEL